MEKRQIMRGLNFVAIDFETATGRRASVCEAGICAVRDGRIVETRSWLVRPPGNAYSYWNMQIHGIRPADTADSPEFPEIWAEISTYLNECPVLVAHNAAFDMGCIRHSLDFYVSGNRTSLTIVPYAPPADFTTSAATVWTTFATISKYPTGSTTVRATTPKCAPVCFSAKSKTRDGAS